MDTPIACTLDAAQYKGRTADLAAVAAEASCCSFLRLDVQRYDGRLVLEIAGPEEARPVIAELFA